MKFNGYAKGASQIAKAGAVLFYRKKSKRLMGFAHRHFITHIIVYIDWSWPNSYNVIIGFYEGENASESTKNCKCWIMPNKRAKCIKKRTRFGTLFPNMEYVIWFSAECRF